MDTATQELDRRSQRKMLAAEGYLALEMYEHALRELQGVTEAARSHFSWHLLKAEAHRGLADWPLALEEFQRCHAEQPTDLAVLMGMAWCFKRIGQLSRAIAAMHDAYLAHREVAVVLYNLSCYYALGGQKTQALSWLARALRMDAGLRRLIPDETDFDPLRHEPEFLKLVELTA